jgi:hypothetical protein
MVKQEDEYAKQNNTQYPRSAEYDVTLAESSIRIKMADGLPDFFYLNRSRYRWFFSA